MVTFSSSQAPPDQGGIPTKLPEGSVMRLRVMQLMVRDEMKDSGEQRDRLGPLSQGKDIWTATSEVLHVLAEDATTETLGTQ